MLRFLHLSDLHFTTKSTGTPFDYDFKIREAILTDLKSKDKRSFDGILITGDIAYHGLFEEFELANSWIEEVRAATNSQPESIFVIPGNHDVNRKHVAEGSSLWELHQMLRREMPHEARNDSLDKKLCDSWDFLSCQKEYRAFASEHECPTAPGNLAWTFILNEALEDGTQVRLHGLNSAILCDDRDAKANLLLGRCQFHHFDSRPDLVNIVLCHHPHSWLLDGSEANDFFRTQAHLILTGHEHDTRCYPEGNSLRLMAGAVHPNRREAKWEPCFHIIELSVENTGARRELGVKIETRVWMDKEKSFGPSVKKDGSIFHQERIQLPVWSKVLDLPQSASSPPGVLPKASSSASVTDNVPPQFDHELFASARRRLIVHFFRLGTISRYEAVIAAGVWEASDDALEGQAKWARVFERAEKTQKLAALWNEVAAREESLLKQPNPFIQK